MATGKLIVFEMLTDDAELRAFSYSYNSAMIRRLTDEEVEGLLISQEILKTHSRTVGAIWWDDIAMKWQSAPKPADDERGRFVRETARMFYAAQLIDRAGPWCPFAEAKAFTEKIW